ncbi:MAG TPA: LuxR C-terminal-related transcriptional regulator [Gaiellaceae bacterium]|nr:LuxR C-terminal-related transcriptional regulator [Gaiellaceae bacterium]
MGGRAGSSGAVFLERAEAERQSGRLLEAGRLAEQGLVQPCSPEIQARLQLVVASVERLEGKWPAAVERLRTEAALVAGTSPATAALLLCEVSRAAFQGADSAAALATATEARRLARRGPSEIRAEAEIALGLAGLITEEGNAEPLLERVVDRTAGSPPTLLGMLYSSSAALVWVERYGEGCALLEQVIDRARRLELLGLLPIALDTLGAIEFRIGRWRASEGHSTEALRLARVRDGAFERASCLTSLARLEAARGRRDKSDGYLEEAEQLCPEHSMIVGYHRTGAALLELSLGRPDVAADHLQGLASSEAAKFEPTVFRWEADFVEALLRAGRGDEARIALERFERRAQSTHRAWTQAVLHRCRGLLAGSDGFEEEFLEALRWHAESPMPFERARTELCFAERLRRARRSTEAQAYFRSALGTFEQLGAEPWALRARRGLSARGRRRRLSPFDVSLSPHESQVAALVQRGATNKEVAATLFVTEKTVEYHLSNIYRKLGIRSRAELAWLLTQRQPEPVRPSTSRPIQEMSPEELEKLVATLEEEMYLAARELRFEHAARLRDELKSLTAA